MNQYCTIYLARHGETEWNVKGLLQGHTDSPLTTTGRSQAKTLAKNLHQIKFSAIYSSDLSRAQHTAQAIALDQTLTVTTTHLLRERFFGRYEGMAWQYFQTKLDKLLAQNQALANHPDIFHQVDNHIESDDVIAERSLRFLREVSLAHINQKIAVVSHGGTMRIILQHLGAYTQKELRHLKIDNTAYALIHSDGTDFELISTSGITLSP